MPTDLDTIEGRLRETLAAAAEQTVIDHDAVLATVSPLAVAGPRRRSPRRAWIAVAVAAAAVLLIGFVVVARTDDASVTTATTPPGPATPSLLVGYVPSSIQAVPPLTVAVGARGEWAGPDRATLVIQSSRQPFRGGASAAEFAGQDGLAFVSQAEAKVILMKDQQDDIKKRYSEVFEEAKTAAPDQQEILKQQKDSLVKQSADLEAQIAVVENTPSAIEGGRDDLTVTISGTVGIGELRKVATSLRIVTQPVPGNEAHLAAGSTVTAPVLDAPATVTISPGPPAVSVPPSTSTSPAATDHPGTPAFTAPLPHGWTLGNGQYSSTGSAPLAIDFAEPLISLPPSEQPPPGFWSWTYTSAAADSGTATITTLYEWQHLGGSLVTDGVSSAPAHETTGSGLSLVDLGERCPVDARATIPYTTPCGRTIAVWNDKIVEVLVVGDPSVDALAYARSLTPRS